MKSEQIFFIVFVGRILVAARSESSFSIGTFVAFTCCQVLPANIFVSEVWEHAEGASDFFLPIPDAGRGGRDEQDSVRLDFP